MSGIILANASLDIAFHDNNRNKLIKELNYENINEDYINKFFVGLLEADGTITTDMRSNNNEYQIARIRIVIALKRNMENINMLNLIKQYVGGKVVLENKKDYEYVIWICQTKQDLIKIFALLAKYPLITARKQSQLNFALKCLEKKYKYNEFVKLRNNKYNDKEKELKLLLNKNIPDYFPQWLSGFIEGEGNFSLVFNEKQQLRKSAFTIGQNDEIHILQWIKKYFNGQTKILKDKPKKGGQFSYYRLYLYNKESRESIFSHFDKYPLLGYKFISYKRFYSYHNNSSV